MFYKIAGWPRSGKKVWKFFFFPGQEKVREFCSKSGKFRKNGKSQGEGREFKNSPIDGMAKAAF